MRGNDEIRNADLSVTPIVMDLDVFKVGRLLERFIIPIQILEPSVDIRVIMLEEIVRNLSSPI